MRTGALDPLIHNRERLRVVAILAALPGGDAPSVARVAVNSVDSPATGDPTLAVMYMPPHISSHYIRERQRDMLARADRRRQLSQADNRVGVSSDAEGTGRRKPRTWRAVLLTRLLPWHRAAQ